MREVRVRTYVWKQLSRNVRFSVWEEVRTRVRAWVQTPAIPVIDEVQDPDVAWRPGMGPQ